jgi:MinD-like ATPase involved in chromosome partitioning or flagellar assembly
MSKLNLIIADNKALFSDIFINYLTNQHSKNFMVHCYIDKEKLEKFFLKNEKEIDILLICPELYYEELENKKIKSIIILSNGRLSINFEKMKTINRFQSGDIIVSQMLNIFSERNSELIEAYPGNKVTKVIGVFSPIGGSGKTSIAIASAITCSLMDKNVFYLNLESIPSTHLFFDCSQELNFSHVLYYLKSRKINFGLKIDAIKVLDPIYNITYFPLQDNLLEQTESMPEEIEFLICSLKNSKAYDVIFIDFSSVIDYKTLKAFGECEEILLVLTQDYMCSRRKELLYKELKVLDRNKNSDNMAKCTILINKYNADLLEDLDNTKEAVFKVPYVSQLFSRNGGKAVINLNNQFGNEINKLMQRVVCL